MVTTKTAKKPTPKATPKPKSAKPVTSKPETVEINAKTIEKEVKKVVKTVKKEGAKFVKDAKKTGQGIASDLKKEFDKKVSVNQVETIKVSGDKLIGKVKELVKEGNIRRITIINKQGKTIAEFPVTLGVLGALIAPALAAIGTIAALVTECTIKIERK